jgi:hypothetical protein
MDVISYILRLFVAISFLCAPQVLGAVIYRIIWKRTDVFAHFLGVLIPPLVFFLATRMVFSSSRQSLLERGGYECGLYEAVSLLILSGGTLGQFLVSLLLHHSWHIQHKISNQEQPQHT